jgi:hypothetical protein
MESPEGCGIWRGADGSVFNRDRNPGKGRVCGPPVLSNLYISNRIVNKPAANQVNSSSKRSIMTLVDLIRAAAASPIEAQLEVGNGGMKENEYRMHMSLWCLLAAPLLAGNDLRKMTPETIAILTNPEAIAVDQDPAGKQGRIVHQEGAIAVMVKPLADGGKAVGLFNREQGIVTVTVNFGDIGLPDEAAVRDLWLGKDLGKFRGGYTVDVPEHSSVLVRIR